MNNKLKIAVIGAGISGILSSFILQKNHDVVLFEKNDYIGGHTNTILVEEQTNVDTGFIVMNNRTYPVFSKFLEILNAEKTETDMSFGYFDKNSGLQFATSSLNSIFALKKNIFSPVYLKMLYEILRFFKETRFFLNSEKNPDMTLGDFLKSKNFSVFFQKHYVIPMASAIWSSPADKIFEFPMVLFAKFYNNHGLLSVSNQPQWYFIKNGSSAYVKKFLNKFKGRIEKNKEVIKISESKNHVEINFENSKTELFDIAVIAAHADEAYKILESPSKIQTRLLSPWEYSKNRVYLHTDLSFLPENKKAWASWNYVREKNSQDYLPACITYDMTRLQKINSKTRYLVTLNPQREIDHNKIIKDILYFHPVFNKKTWETQKELHLLNKKENRILFCGSYFGCGFHEDGAKSASDLCKVIGEKL